jgi:hypothetical protein
MPVTASCRRARSGDLLHWSVTPTPWRDQRRGRADDRRRMDKPQTDGAGIVMIGGGARSRSPMGCNDIAFPARRAVQSRSRHRAPDPRHEDLGTKAIRVWRRDFPRIVLNDRSRSRPVRIGPAW